MNNNSSKSINISLIVYSFILKFLVSINSIRFSEVFTDSDQSIFFTIGKAILNGKVLYKDVFDHKTPYIYFANAFAAMFPKNHLGLYIIEVLLLSITLIFTFKFCRLFIDDVKSFLICMFFSVFLCMPNITFSYSRTEEYAIAFMMVALFLFSRTYFKVAKDENKSENVIDMFLIGVMAGLTLMTNIRATILFLPFALAIFIRLIIEKKYIYVIKLFVAGFLGVIVSILPYIIYMIATDSASDAYYAIITTNINYSKSTIDTGKDVLSTAIMMISEHPLIYLFVILSFVSLFLLSFDIYLKASIILSLAIAFLYVTFSNRTYVYYLVIFSPYFISLCFMAFKMFKNRKNDKISKTPVSSNIYIIIFITIFLIINLFFNRTISNRNINHMHRSERLKNVINEYFDKDYKVKLLAVGFTPEFYSYIDSVVNYKYFIIPNISYKVDSTAYISQYNYLANSDPDIVVYRETSTVKDFPKDMDYRIRYMFSTTYKQVDVIRTNETEGSIYLFVKNKD